MDYAKLIIRDASSWRSGASTESERLCVCTEWQGGWAWNVSSFCVSYLTKTLPPSLTHHKHTLTICISHATAATPTPPSLQLISPGQWPLSTGLGLLSPIYSCRLNRGRHSQPGCRYTYVSYLLSSWRAQRNNSRVLTSMLLALSKAIFNILKRGNSNP